MTDNIQIVFRYLTNNISSPCLVDIPASSSLAVRTSKESSSPSKEAPEKISHESREQLEVKIEQIGRYCCYVSKMFGQTDKGFLLVPRQLNSLEERLAGDIQTILALLQPNTGTLTASKVQLQSLKSSSQNFTDPSQVQCSPLTLIIIDANDSQKSQRQLLKSIISILSSSL